MTTDRERFERDYTDWCNRHGLLPSSNYRAAFDDAYHLRQAALAQPVAAGDEIGQVYIDAGIHLMRGEELAQLSHAVNHFRERALKAEETLRAHQSDEARELLILSVIRFVREKDGLTKWDLPSDEQMLATFLAAEAKRVYANEPERDAFDEANDSVQDAMDRDRE